MSKGDQNISDSTSYLPEDEKKFRLSLYRMARSGGIIVQSKLFLALFMALFQSLVGNDRENGETDKEETKPKTRMTKPKGTRVTFQDMVKEYEERQQSREDSKASEDLERNEGEIEQEEANESGDSKPDSESEEEKSERKEESKGSKSEDEKNIVLTPDMADLMLSYLDLMNLRMLQCECTTTHLLKRHIAGAQERLDEAKRLLDNVPTTMSHTERKVYMLEICQYVESIFSNLERLTVKVVKYGGENMCDIIDEFSENVKSIESTVVERPPEASKMEERFSDDALWVMETGVMVCFVVLSLFVVFLLTRDDIGGAFVGFLVTVWNNSRVDFKSNVVVANETVTLES